MTIDATNRTTPVPGALSGTTKDKTLADNIFERLNKLSILPGTESAVPGVRTLDLHQQQSWDAGVKNQKYYLELAAKSGKEWFRHPRHDFQYSEFVLASMEMGQQLMEHNPNNRKLLESDSDAYARDILNNRWIQTDESISINVLGDMINGQHRIDALLKAGKPHVFYFTFQVPNEARFVQDSGRRRSVNEKLKIVFGGHMGSKLPAVCRSAMRGLGKGTKFSESEIAEFVAKHEETIKWVIQQLPSTRADVQAVVFKAALWWGQEKIEPFCNRYRNLMFSSTADPTAVLYRWLTKKKDKGVHQAIVVYRKALASMNAFIEEKEIRSLYEREQDIFDWNAGWSVPEDAPINN